MKKYNEFLNEGVFDYDANQVADTISGYVDELTHWGTQTLDKKDKDDIEYITDFVGDVTNGDKYFVAAIIKYNDKVKNKKQAQKWLVNAIFDSSGDPARQKMILNALRQSI